MAASGVRRQKLCFVGEVQGVGFRWTTRNIANKLDLTGWVRNEWDGSVSMELQGTDDQIAKVFGTLPHSWGRFCPTFQHIPPSSVNCQRFSPCTGSRNVQSRAVMTVAAFFVRLFVFMIVISLL